MDESRFDETIYQYLTHRKVGEEKIQHTEHGRISSELNLGARTV